LFTEVVIGYYSLSNGYIYSDNESLREQIKATAASLSLAHGNVFSTYATIAAYQHGKKWFDGFSAYTEQTRDWIVSFMSAELPDMTTFLPEGTNQIWFDFSGLGLESNELKSLLTKQAKMALTSGTWFDEPNENFYRMNFAAPREQVQTSLQLLKTALDSRS
jgi:cystathionine beta-lyase